MLNSQFWQAFFALSPILLVLLAISRYIYSIYSIIDDFSEIIATGNFSASIIFGNIAAFLAFILVSAFISIGSLIFYIMHAVQNEKLRKNGIFVLWILLFVFFGGIGKLIYWIVEIVAKRKTVGLTKTKL